MGQFNQADEFTGVVVEPPEKRKRGLSEETRRHARWPWFFLGCFFLCCLCWVLPLCLLGVAGASIGSLFDRNEVSTSGTKTVSLTGMASGDELTLDVRNYIGDITIRGADTNEVTVDYTKTAYGFSKTESNNTLNDINVDATLDGTTVTVRVTDRKEFRDYFKRTNTVDLTITVPQDVHLRVRNNIGKVVVTNVNALSTDIENNAALNKNTNNTDMITVSFTGTFDPAGEHLISATAGEIVVNVPPGDSYLRLDAAADVGDITVAQPFKTSDVQTNDDYAGASWQGVIGSGTGDPADLRLRTVLGNIQIQTGTITR